jgi:SMODS and SLOG-associating 2TM effector domain family 4
MFALTVVDHLRLDAEQAARNYALHARIAERLARAALVARIAMASLLALATGAAVADLWFRTRVYAVVALVAIGVVFVAFAFYLVVGLETRVHAHRTFAHRLWIVAERYRALLAEIGDGLVDRSALLDRRDDLMRQLHLAYEHGFALDQAGHESARLPTLPHEEAA